MGFWKASNVKIGDTFVLDHTNENLEETINDVISFRMKHNQEKESDSISS